MKIQSIKGVCNKVSSYRGVSAGAVCSANGDAVSPKTNISVSPSFRGDISRPCYYAISSIYMGQLDKLKAETQMFPNDIPYREQLLLNAGLNPADQHKIRSIIGPDEIKSVMSQYDSVPEVFSAGPNRENIANKSIRANLHMHTRASDGRLTVSELLDKAAEYADKVRKENPKTTEPFVVAITDHDTLEGAQEAIKLIADNPVKYRNLRVILGVEMTTFNNVAPNLVQKPTNTHVLVYGIDPNEKGLKNFIDGVKAKKMRVQNLMTETANQTYKKHFGKEGFYSVPEVRRQYTTVDRNVCGIYQGMEAYFRTKAVVEGVLLKDVVITDALKKRHIPTDTEKFLEKLRDFRNPIDNNNKTFPPERTLPEFVSVMTDMDAETVSDRLAQGMKEEKFAQFNRELMAGMDEYKVTFTPKYDYIPTFETLYDGLKTQDRVVVGIAHPLDAVKTIEKKEDRFSFLKEFYSKFKSGCKEKAGFTEAYYQSYTGELKEFNTLPETQKFFKKVGKIFKLFRTGSADSHGLSIFTRL